LAIELAASRIGVLTPRQLLDRLNDRFALLAGHRGGTTRQSTLRRAIDWSWSLLNEYEQAALAQCSVFEGGFTVAAAEAVLDLHRWSHAPSVLDVVQALLDKSLLRLWMNQEESPHADGQPRFGMYVSIREYATERLHADELASTQTVEERHGRYFAQFGIDENLETLSRHHGDRLRKLLVVEIDNVVAACRRAVARKDRDICVPTYRAVWEVLELQGPLAPAISLGRDILSLPGLAERDQMLVLMTMAFPLHRGGRRQEAAQCLQEALSLSISLSDRRCEGRILGHLGTLHSEQGGISEAQRDLERAIALHRETDDSRAEGASLGNLGNVYFDRGKMREAHHYYDAALSVNSRIGNRRIEGSVLGNLALLQYEQGRLEDAARNFTAALTIHREVGNRRFEGTVLGNLAILRFAQGRWDEATAHYEAALDIHRTVGNRRDEGLVLGNLGELYFTQQRWDEAHSCYMESLLIAREVGYRRAEGTVLGSLGELLARQGRFEEARQALRDGGAVLRELGDSLGLGKLLCAQARVELADGEAAAARAALVEAESLAVVVGAGSESELGHQIADLKTLL
jgi:tetratricopeptide (TPR) repeat protein